MHFNSTIDVIDRIEFITRQMHYRGDSSDEPLTTMNPKQWSEIISNSMRDLSLIDSAVSQIRQIGDDGDDTRDDYFYT